MLSLRTRLTLAYAFLIGVFLSIVCFFVGRFIADSFLHQVYEDLDASANVVRSVVAEHPLASQQQMKLLVLKQTEHPEILVRFYPSPDNQIIDRLPSPFVIVAGLRRIRIPTHRGFVDVIINQPFLAPVFRTLIEIFIGMALCVLVSSWLLARLLTREAIRPLLLVIEELRRFAGGDFSPPAVAEIDRDELGELTAAYNAAALQVSQAFDEHIRVEEQMKRFVADASHELRTPLTVISGYLDILQRMDPHDVPGHDRAFRTLNVETKRMRLLVDRLVALARLERTERAQREVLDMRTVINDVVLEMTAARGIVIGQFTEENFQILADVADVYDAVRNLLENSVKYGEGSAVSVELFTKDGCGYVRVRDNGPGIPEHERSHLFERFYRGGRRADIEGSGLGLSIVARAMQRSCGSVILESAEIGDTRFLLSFPLYKAG